MLAPMPFSSSIYLATEAILTAGSPAQKRELLPKLASGECIATFAHAEGPGGSAIPATTFSRGTLTGAKLPVPDGDVAHLAVVTAKSGKDVVLAVVDLTGTGVERTAVRSIDPSRSLATLRFDRAPAEVLGKPHGRAGRDRAGGRIGPRCSWRSSNSAAPRGLSRSRASTHWDGTRSGGPSHRSKPSSIGSRTSTSKSSWRVPVAYYGAWALGHDTPELGIAACGARAVPPTPSHSWARR